MKSFAHYRQKIRDKGVRNIITGRLSWYALALRHRAFLTGNWILGRYIELGGNTVELDGITLSLDCPLIRTVDKGPFLLGVYERAERELSRRHIDPNLPIVEIGASIGGVSCITNRLLRDPKRHVVIECNPFVLPTLEKNKMINGCRFSIEPCAIAYSADTIEFTISSEYFMAGRIGGRGHAVNVPSSTLRKIIEKHKLQEINLISDSEGGEVEMVENEPDVLADHVSRLILEVHPREQGEASIARMLATLSELGFRKLESAGDTVVLANTKFNN